MGVATNHMYVFVVRACVVCSLLDAKLEVLQPLLQLPVRKVNEVCDRLLRYNDGVLRASECEILVCHVLHKRGVAWGLHVRHFNFALVAVVARSVGDERGRFGIAAAVVGRGDGRRCPARAQPKRPPRHDKETLEYVEPAQQCNAMRAVVTCACGTRANTASANDASVGARTTTPQRARDFPRLHGKHAGGAGAGRSDPIPS